LKKFVLELYQAWIAERPSQSAAALAFSSMFSFAPVIFIAISMVGIFADEIQVGAQMYQRLESVLGEEVALLVQESIAALSTPTSSSSILVSLISLVALFMAASGVFFQLQYALNLIWHVPPAEKGSTIAYIRQRLFSFVSVIGMGLLGIIAVLTNLNLSWFGSFLEKWLGISANLEIIAGVAAFILVVMTIALFYKLLQLNNVAGKPGIQAKLVSHNLGRLYFIQFAGPVGRERAQYNAQCRRAPGDISAMGGSEWSLPFYSKPTRFSTGTLTLTWVDPTNIGTNAPLVINLTIMSSYFILCIM
jgi:hypothetical protein